MDRGQSQGKRKRTEEGRTEGASASSSVCSAATGVGSDPYDVFLSFRGSDTRKEFTDHLYHSLVKASIVPMYVFKDDKSILIGEEFGSQIFDAIVRSKISIPIISENYASSKWCLHELIHIMDRKKSSSHIVLPIFYKVSPSDVRHLKGNFGEAFCESEKCFNDEDIHKVKQALGEVSSLHGWESTKVANGHEGELIQLVIRTVLNELHKDFQLDIPRQLVGVDGRLREIMNWIRIPSINARMIGIYGMGGIGKTTLAKCIYNQLLDEFEHASFVPNIREKDHDGIKDLQSQLISDILHSKIKVSRIDDGINIIKSRFKEKNVLILLDDIDDKNQLNVLARDRDWFMAGSMIIVTTRNEAVLDQSEFEVDYKYELEGLDEVQSLLLFNRHAFRMDHSPRDFESISHDIISTMDGLPLALEVVGSYLYKKTNQKVWEDVRRQLKSQLHRDVQKTLRISYDVLEDGHKQIFLDIACFFIGESLDYLGKYMRCMWEDYGSYPCQGIEELKLRCLIKIGDHGEFEMHDQLRDLGRSIFCQGQPLEKQNGPWDHDYDGVPRVLRQNECARFDDLMRAAANGDKDLSEIRWLKWKIDESNSSLSTANLHLPKLSVLDLAWSNIAEDWEGWRSFKSSTRLRVLNLAVCSNLRSTTDLSAFTKLKILILNHCPNLEHIHPSIGKLKSLVSLDLSYCYSLKELPEEVGELKDLEELDFTFCGITQIPTSIRYLGKLKRLDVVYCKSLRRIPRSIVELHDLKHLDISYSGIEKLPNAIGRLTNLQSLNISSAPIFYLPESICNLSSLQRLHLKDCNKLRPVLELPLSLAHLLVSHQSFKLPQLSSLIHLEELDLEECHLLEDIIELPSPLWKLDGFRYLEALSVKYCSTIEILDLSELVHLKRLDTRFCNNLVEIQGLDNLEFLEFISIWDCNSINNILYLKSRCLKQLEVVNCGNLVEIQGHLDSAKFLERLYITRCRLLETLPDLTACKKLRCLSTRGCKKLTHIQGLEKLDLIVQDISGCDSLEAIPKLSGEQFV